MQEHKNTRAQECESRRCSSGVIRCCPNAHCFLQLSNLSRLEGHSPELADLDMLNNMRARVTVGTQTFKNHRTKREPTAKIFDRHLCTRCEGWWKKHRGGINVSLRFRNGSSRLQESDYFWRYVDVVVNFLRCLCLHTELKMTLKEQRFGGHGARIKGIKNSVVWRCVDCSILGTFELLRQYVTEGINAEK